MSTSTFFATTSTAVVALGGITVWSVIHPSSRMFGRVYHRGQSNEPRYALTFDDGPTDPSTPAILDALGELRAPAAFFVIGQNVRRYPQLLARIHAEGHLIGNHSFDHRRLGFMRGPFYWRRQLEQTNKAVEQVIGQRPAMFRPPMGIRTWINCSSARRSGHAVVTWTRRGLDGIATTPEAILRRLVPATRPGDILVLHDGLEPDRRRDPAATLAAVRPLIQRLRDRGLEPIRLDELLNLPAYAPVTGPARATAAATAQNPPTPPAPAVPTNA